MRCKFAAEPRKIESSIDLPHQMILGDCVIELKLVEKLRLFALQPTHHGLPPPRFASARWNHGSPQASTDFCNIIGTFETCRDVRLWSLLGDKRTLGGHRQTVENDPELT